MFAFIGGMWLGAGIVVAFGAWAITIERSIAKERRDGKPS